MENALLQLLGSAAQAEPSMGRADSIPAKLSEGEYVIPADVVAMLGDGNNNAGARILDKLVETVRMNYKGNTKSPDDHQAFRGMMNGQSGKTQGP